MGPEYFQQELCAGGVQFAVPGGWLDDPAVCTGIHVRPVRRPAVPWWPPDLLDVPGRAAYLGSDAAREDGLPSRRAAAASSTDAASAASGNSDLPRWVGDRGDGNLPAAAATSGSARTRLIGSNTNQQGPTPRWGLFYAASALPGSRAASSTALRSRSISSIVSFFPSVRVK